MQTVSRRSFLKSAAVATGFTAVFPRPAFPSAYGANDTIRLGMIGLGGKGADHLNAFYKLPGTRIVALCDADRDHLAKAADQLEKLGGKADQALDARRIYDRSDVDAVVIATPNHSHALLAVWACQAGKDVYVEKPISHEIWEGRQLTQAARKYKRIVQPGTQSRSDPALHEAFDLLQKGELGPIRLVRGFCYKRRKSIGKVSGPQTIPASVDYNLWCGPAPMDPLLRQNLHYDWHWVWPTGNGDIGNQGIHELDMCRWAAGHKAAAPAVLSLGGRFGYVDDATTPNTQAAFFDYPKIPILFEVRGLPMSKDIEGEAMDSYKSIRIGLVVECENGYFAGGGGGGWFFDPQGKRLRQFKGPGGRDHQQNFLDAVRSRKPSDLNGNIEECHISCTLFHQANISHRLGQKRSPDETRERLRGNAIMTDALGRMLEHLAANEVRLTGPDLTLGPWLKFKPAKEVFTGDLAKEANAFLKRDYRAPFVIPNKV